MLFLSQHRSRDGAALDSGRYPYPYRGIQYIAPDDTVYDVSVHDHHFFLTPGVVAMEVGLGAAFGILMRLFQHSDSSQTPAS